MFDVSGDGCPYEKSLLQVIYSNGNASNTCLIH